MKKLIAALSVLAVFGMAFPAFAQTTSTPTSTLQSLLAQIAQLQEQINKLQAQKQEAIAKLVTTLKEGSTGDQVKLLQAILAADPEIYPEGRITGYFGALTKQAVRKFQKKHGIETLGNVGPKTMAKVNELLEVHPILMSSSTSTSSAPCAIVPPGHLIAKGWLKKNAPPVVPPCQVIPPGILKKLSTSTPPIAPTSTPDIIPPVISGITTTVSSTSAVVNWTTNESATSEVVYGTSTALGMTTGLNTSMATSHSVNMTGLTASTTYYYVIHSKDAANNLATSTQQSFTTSQ